MEGIEKVVLETNGERKLSHKKYEKDPLFFEEGIGNVNKRRKCLSITGNNKKPLKKMV